MVNFPAYPRKPHKSGAARINVPTSEGKRKSVYLGEFGSLESREEYRRLMAEWDAAKGGGATPWEGAVKTVAALVERFWVGLEAVLADFAAARQGNINFQGSLAVRARENHQRHRPR